jgi:hypothetical protein
LTFDDQFPSKFVDLGEPEDIKRNIMLGRTSFNIRVDPSPQKQHDDGEFSGVYAHNVAISSSQMLAACRSLAVSNGRQRSSDNCQDRKGFAESILDIPRRAIQ